MTSEQHYTVKVKGTTRTTESRNFDAEYDVPYTVKPEDLLDYIKEQVEAIGFLLFLMSTVRLGIIGYLHVAHDSQGSMFSE